MTEGSEEGRAGGRNYKEESAEGRNEEIKCRIVEGRKAGRAEKKAEGNVKECMDDGRQKKLKCINRRAGGGNGRRKNTTKEA